MRQNVPTALANSDSYEPTQSAASRAGQSIDEWIAAALSEQAGRAEARSVRAQSSAQTIETNGHDKSADEAPRGRKPARSRPPVEKDTYDTIVAATSASERRAIETAAKTAVALGSVASWIERAQERLNETSRSASESQERTATMVDSALGKLGIKLETIERKVESAGHPSEEALQAVGRIESRLADREAAGLATPDFREVMHGFEDRLREISERIVPVPAPEIRPIGKRGLPAETEVQHAVAEIRAHQSDLDSGRLPPRGAAQGGLAGRVEAETLRAIRADLARIAGKVGTDAAPESAAIIGLRTEIEQLRGSLDGLATRADLGAVERSISALSGQVSEVREQGGSLGLAAERIEALQAEIRRLAGTMKAADESRLSRDIDVLSHKLDIVAASGVDPALTAALTTQLADIRHLLGAAAPPTEIAALGQQLLDLKQDIADIGSRQVDPSEFALLRLSVEEMRNSITSAPRRAAADGATLGLASAPDLEPIQTMLVSLAEKLDRVERHLPESDALDQLEHQIAGLSGRLGETPARDPGLASLEQTVGELMSEVSSWRDGTIEVAERAARSAVEAAMGQWPPAADDGRSDFERHLADLRSNTIAIERRTQASLDAVHATLEQVVERIASLEAEPPEAPATGKVSRPAAAPLAIKPLAIAPDALPEPVLALPSAPIALSAAQSDTRDADPFDLPVPDAGQPTPRLGGEEILLEPGTPRPNGAAPAGTPAEIKSSFIAAARRAAQAAAAESGSGKGKSALGADAHATPSLLAQRIRSSIDRQRRPMLLAAAAVVLALGALQVSRLDLGGASREAVASRSNAPTEIAMTNPPAAAIVARPDIADPTSTQALPEPAQAEAARLPAAPADAKADITQASALPQAPTSSPAKSEESIPAKSPVVASVQPPSRVPLEPAGNALPPGLKSAALAGNPVALFELATRTSEGRGVPRDPSAAAALFEKAAEKGLAPAQYRIGNIYEKGVGVPKNLDAAKTWYRRAAETGNVRAMHNLAVLMADGTGGGKPDFAGALVWFQRAAEHGIRDSQFNLAVLYARGLGTAQDLSRSFTWFAIAAAQGDGDATRKRDEVAAHLAAADLARAKSAAEAWKPAAPTNSANDVQIPVAGWIPEPSLRQRASRDGKA